MTSREERVLSYIQGIRESDGVTSAQLEEMLVTPGAFASDNAAGLTLSDEAMAAWQKVERGEKPTQADISVLESVILGNGLRPAVDIQNDSYGHLPSMWQALNDQRPVLEALIRGVGRLDLSGHDGVSYAGTAFVCGERLIVTNRHVAEFFADGVGLRAQLSFKPGIGAFVDMKQEVGSPASVVIKTVAPVLVLDDWDVAVIAVDALPNTCAPLPLQATAPAVLANRVAATIGYPQFNPAEDLVQQIKIFRGVFDKKRLQPGRVRGMLPVSSYGRTVEALAHDCSTLTGNSGSAVVDVATGTVIGVHFKGTPHESNYAVPTWALAQDPRAVDLGVNFAN